MNLLMLILGLFIVVFRDRDLGTMLGAVGGSFSAVVTMVLPTLITYGTYDGWGLWLVIILVAGFIIGAIGGTLLGWVGRRIARDIFGADKENVGTVVGGLIGGILPWVILNS